MFINLALLKGNETYTKMGDSEFAVTIGLEEGINKL